MRVAALFGGDAQINSSDRAPNYFF